MVKTDVQTCKVCGCTEDDCRICVRRTGKPCHWVTTVLCSACREIAEARIPEPYKGPRNHEWQHGRAFVKGFHAAMRGDGAYKNPYYKTFHEAWRLGHDAGCEYLVNPSQGALPCTSAKSPSPRGGRSTTPTSNTATSGPTSPSRRP